MKQAIFLGFLFATTFMGAAQVAPTSALYKTILSKDSLLFNIGFNTCDISQFDTLLTDDFEFFHDKDSISNKSIFLHNLRNGLCGSPSTYHSRRELVKGSTEIYPLYKGEKLYGAIQTGIHRFYETLSGKKERWAGSAKFTHVWLQVKGEWKLARSLSFDHRAADKEVGK